MSLPKLHQEYEDDNELEEIPLDELPDTVTIVPSYADACEGSWDRASSQLTHDDESKVSVASKGSLTSKGPALDSRQPFTTHHSTHSPITVSRSATTTTTTSSSSSSPTFRNSSTSSSSYKTKISSPDRSTIKHYRSRRSFAGHEDISKEPAKEEEKFIIDETERKRVLRKADWHLLPFVSLLYLFSFLDRANIGNARIAGMEHDVELHGLRYNVVAAIFFIPYALCEVPSNICLKLMRPSRWIPSIMVAWGIVMTLMCLCHSYEGLIAGRFFLGLTEGGLFPGITFYLSLWYRRRDVAQRIAIFYSAATIAGAFGGILAFGISEMEGAGDLHGWQWIFCLEGLATVVVGFLSYFLMNDYPDSATFLTANEKEIMVQSLKQDSHGLAKEFRMTYVWQAVRDYKTYVQAGIQLGVVVPIYAISLFMPTIVREMGFRNADAQLLTIPPFVAGCITTVIAGHLSDKYNKRGPFIIICATVSLIGYIVLYTQTRTAPLYVGAVLAAMGVYPCAPVDIAWAGSTAGGDVRRGVTLGIVIGIANLGGLCSSFVYITPPRFHLGHGIMMGWLGLSILLSCFAMWDYNRLNKKKKEICTREGIDPSKNEEFRQMGNDSPLYRYTL
ncbi:major facilitator superfamily domain-containing protein [Crucibulum laeve]|uniref:Major facilitator superfamily domain-containing protein n=1 Tax=Crucibulum laeve TaxID=68775 RepID=A0A5C3MJQ6_9AGAR|nr:major facilitator superfamily domain-containing protein [Crucibulum laeve]